MKSIDQIKQELRTEEGLAIGIQEQLCDRLSQWFGSMGYLGSAFTNTKADTKAKEWVWEDQYGKKITFRNPVYRDQKSKRDNPVVKTTKTKSADTFNIYNSSDVPINQVFDQTYSVRTNAKFSKTDAFNFEVSTGFEGGVMGVATNWGAHALISFNAKFGGQFIRQWDEETGTSKSKSIKQDLVLAPKSHYQLDVYIDEIDMEVDVHAEGVMDFEIEVDLSEAHWNGDIQVYSTGNSPDKYEGEVIKAESLEAMVRHLLGITGGHVKRKARFDRQIAKDHDHLVGLLEYILCTEYRKVKTSTTLEYNDAGKISVKVTRVGDAKDESER